MSGLLKEKPVYTTIEEFDKLPEDNTHIYELFEGEIYMSPRPNWDHQSIMSNLHYAIKHYFKGKKRKPCDVFTEVELEIKGNVIIPDITIMCNIDTRGIQRSKQPPTLVIEILSPSNSAMEMEDKKQLYKSHGIKELWIVNPKLKTIAIYDLQKGTDLTYANAASFNPIAFPDLSINLDEVFDL